MIFYLYKSNDANRQYVVDEKMTISDFFSMIVDFGRCFGVTPSFTSAPEAEFARVILASGKIFFKYDLVDGMELTCVGLSKDQIFQLEDFLMKR